MIARLAAAAAVLAACSGSGGTRYRERDPEQPKLPQADTPRAETAGAPVLQLAPAGADVVLELDLARLRANDTVGPLYGGLAARVAARYDALAGADAVVVCAYRVGTASAESLTFVVGDGVADPEDRGARIDERIVVLGPAGLVKRVGGAEAIAGDKEFMRLRDAAMPARATGAAARLTARLSFDARVGVARELDVDAVPAGVSVWGDVIDDLAIVALLSGDDGDDALALAEAVESWRAGMLEDPAVHRWGLVYLLRGVTVKRSGNVARVVFLVGPRTLQLMSRKLAEQLES